MITREGVIEWVARLPDSEKHKLEISIQERRKEILHEVYSASIAEITESLHRLIKDIQEAHQLAMEINVFDPNIFDPGVFKWHDVLAKTVDILEILPKAAEAKELPF